MNVMITCAGRRRTVVEAFKAALAEKGGKVIAVDGSATAPAVLAADERCLVPPIEEPCYVDILQELCERHEVKLLVPAFEAELPVLDRNRKRFDRVGTSLLVSNSAVIETCHDKLACAAFLARYGITSPPSFCSPTEALRAVEAGEVRFPLVVKPRRGVGSAHCEVVRSPRELELAFGLVELRLNGAGPAGPEQTVLIQPLLEGHEYGLDVINDLQGRHVCTLVRRKIRLRLGSTDRATTVSHRGLEVLGRRIGEALGHAGMLDCDVILSGRDCHVLDLNPRIGGGYPFSHVAGANFPAAVIAWLEGKAADPAWFCPKPNVTASRVDDLVIVDGPAPL